MKSFSTFLLLMFLITSAAAQTFSLKGKVVDNNNEPLIGVNLIAKKSNIGTQTDIDGKFELKDIQESTTIIVSYIGYKTKEVSISKNNKEILVVLYEGNEILQEVVVDANRENKFSRKKTAYVAKLPLRDMENAHVYSTVTTELLESQIVTNLDEAMTNATGVYKLWEGTGRAPGDGTSYYSMRGFSTQPKLIDGVAGVTFSAVEPSYIERIEVIKGPNATLFGSTETSLGGLINVVTKKPFKGTAGSISYTLGSFGLHRGSVDYNTPLGKGNNVYFRVNASYLNQDSFQDAGFKDTYFIAPSVSFKVNEKLNINAGFDFSKTKQTNPSMLFLRRGFPLVSTTIDEIGIDPTKSYTSNDIYLTNPVFNTRVVGDYKISDKWTSQTIFSGNYGETTGDYQYQFDGGAAGLLQLNSINQGFDANIAQLQAGIDAIGDPTNPQSIALQTQLAQVNFVKTQVGTQLNPMLQEAGGLLMQDAFTRVYSRRDASAKQFNVQQNFTGDFKVGEIRNRFVGGVDFLSKSSNIANKSGYPGFTSTSNFPQLFGTLNAFGLTDISNQVAGGFAAFPYFDAFVKADGSVIPSTFTPNASAAPNKAALDANFDLVAPNIDSFSSQTLAAYISDVININQNLSVSVGLRLDHFMQDGSAKITEDDFNKTTFSPSAGVVYQPILNKLSLFANYQTGFTNVDPIFDQNEGGFVSFDPQKAVQFEGGFKTNFFNSKLNIGASYYHITVNDFVSNDPTAPIFPRSIDIAEAVSKGFELEVNANPINGLNIRASLSKNDMEYTDVTSEKAGREVTELANRRPESAGAETVYNLWADYKFQEGNFLENFGIGAGLNGASEHLTVNNALSGTFTLPSYTIYNASMYYNAKKFRVGVKVNNLTDKAYYTGWSTINAQAPRAILGTVSYKF
ncbi:MAG: TonB-dependent receptor domain-containing protein [Tenacibaculum sp.]